jgi:hypothetical protein
MLGHPFDASTHEIDDLIKLPFDNRAHRMHFVGEATFIDQIDAFRDVLADTFTNAHWHDAHL